MKIKVESPEQLLQKLAEIADEMSFRHDWEFHQGKYMTTTNHGSCGGLFEYIAWKHGGPVVVEVAETLKSLILLHDIFEFPNCSDWPYDFLNGMNQRQSSRFLMREFEKAVSSFFPEGDKNGKELVLKFNIAIARAVSARLAWKGR